MKPASVVANIRALWVAVAIVVLIVVVGSLLLWSYIAGLQSAQDDLAKQVFELSHR